MKTYPNILYIDIDSLRPDHLGCHGYARPTSPCIDALAAESVIHTRCYATDAPCMPSRTALFSGRNGLRTGVMNHGGALADPVPEGVRREFKSAWARDALPQQFRNLGYHTASASSFSERHSAFHFNAGFNEVFNSGQWGMETADAVVPWALDWLGRRASADSPWMLHLNLWDPHTPYRTPAGHAPDFPPPPALAWHTEEVRRRHWAGSGPRGAQDTFGWIPGRDGNIGSYPLQPARIDSQAAFVRFIDGYDRGVHYADHHVGLVIARLSTLGLLDNTIVIVSSDHGENLGELNIYGDHQTADHITARVPLIVRDPTRPRAAGAAPGPEVNHALLHPGDYFAGLLRRLGASVPASWVFRDVLAEAPGVGREFLVTSQMAWTAQRGVVFGDHLYLRTYHDGWHDWPGEMLFNLVADPHETTDLAAAEPALVERARNHLETWLAEELRHAPFAADPVGTVLAEGGPYHVRGTRDAYLARLRETGRGEIAGRLAARHPAG